MFNVKCDDKPNVSRETFGWNVEKMFHVKHFVDNERKKWYTSHDVK